MVAPFSRKLSFCLLGAALSIGSWMVQAAQAEIISLIGKGDTRLPGDADWKPAVVRQSVTPGEYVRTGDLSQMALLLDDQTQLRLNQNSIMQIKEISATRATTKLELNEGRIWAQAKRRAFPTDSGLPPAVMIQTPNVTAAIRGTDWELVVSKEGAATLTVLSGVVDFYNDLGRVSVLSNEQAHVEPGKAPTKILLTNARERVQWVTAYRPQPSRWGDGKTGELAVIAGAIEAARYSDALPALESRSKSSPDPYTALLLADLYLSLGRVSDAITVLERHQDSPKVASLLARALLIADRATDADTVLAAAQMKHPRHPEIILAKGDLARFNGKTAKAKADFQQVLADDQNNPEAWFGIGRIEAEREAVRESRNALGRAIELNPDGPGYQGELATLESYANEFDTAQRAFHAALAQQSDDYVTLTGLGILQLKRGDPGGALESLLKSGVIEPRYARGALYTGIDYYQLGNYSRAMEMFRRAAELDPQDPLPHMLMSIAATDRMAFGEAVSAARRAAELMPYLKSANQLLNDQKGNANIGTALAQFGMEDWAQAYAYNSYTPYWAGSHLFLADRHSGDFVKNSELFMGFLSDPTVFGASNRFSTLVASPGHYATIGGRQVREDTKNEGMTLTANGYSVSQIPFSYFVAADPIRANPGRSNQDVNGDNYTIGLGLRPSHDLGFFFFGNTFGFDGAVKAAGSSPFDVAIKDKNRRNDAGMSFKFSPTSQLWVKAGSGWEDSIFGGNYAVPGIASTLNLSLDLWAGWGKNCSAFVPGGCYSSAANFDRYVTRSDQSDIQLRHTFDPHPDWQVSWGLEHGRQKKPFDIRVGVSSLLGFIPSAAITFQGDDGIRSEEAYIANRIRLTDMLTLQVDLSHTRLSQHQWTLMGSDLSLPGTSVQQGTRKDREISEWNPRLGFVWQTVTGQTLRFALQDWRKPAAVNTLAPVDTAGIPVDDRLVALGGKLKRAHAQYEWEVTTTTFVQGFLDAKHVSNLNNSTSMPVSDFGLADLQRLNSHNRLLPQTTDFWEATPLFGKAAIESTGLAINQIFDDNLSGSLRYIQNRSNNTGSRFPDNQVPWLPRHLLRVGTQWLPVARWQLGFTATYRSSRYKDEANTQILDAGWNFGLRSYWECEDKHWSVEGVLDNLHANKASAPAYSPRAGIQVLYRF